jgi:hypothetical protein
MKVCSKCHQFYIDETFSFCLNDGTQLSDAAISEETQILGTNASIVTVISNRPAQSEVAVGFQGKYVFDETATDGLSLKVISTDEDDVNLGFKIPIKNLALERRDVYVTIKALDAEGFELDEYTLSGKVNPGELRVFTDKFPVSHAVFNQVADWRLEEISSYE